MFRHHARQQFGDAIDGMFGDMTKRRSTSGSRPLSLAETIRL